MKKLLIISSVVLILGCVSSIIYNSKKSDNIIEEYFNSDDTLSEGKSPVYKKTELEIKNEDYYVTIVKTTDSEYFIFYLSEIRNGGYVSGSGLLNKDIEYFKILTGDGSERYYGISIGNGSVDYKEKVKFFQQESISLKVNDEYREYIVWSLELYQNQQFDDNNIEYK